MHAAELLSKRTDLTPYKTVLVELGTGQRFSYADLNKRASKLVNFMHDQLDVIPNFRDSILIKNRAF